MNRRVSPTLIGAFVVGAILLSVLAVVMFGSGRYFHKTYEFVLYFPSTVNGLRAGAPVKFRGVEIGSVKDIRLQLEQDLDPGPIPVIIEIDPEKLTSRGTTETILNNPQVRKAAIDRGLRGQLQVESFVTGVLFSRALKALAQQITGYLRSQSSIHTVAFVDHKAYSAGIMIGLACDELAAGTRRPAPGR